MERLAVLAFAAFASHAARQHMRCERGNGSGVPTSAPVKREVGARKVFKNKYLHLNADAAPATVSECGAEIFAATMCQQATVQTRKRAWEGGAIVS
jgi:hypothetical protein